MFGTFLAATGKVDVVAQAQKELRTYRNVTTERLAGRVFVSAFTTHNREYRLREWELGATVGRCLSVRETLARVDTWLAEANPVTSGFMEFIDSLEESA